MGVLKARLAALDGHDVYCQVVAYCLTELTDGHCTKHLARLFLELDPFIRAELFRRSAEDEIGDDFVLFERRVARKLYLGFFGRP